MAVIVEPCCLLKCNRRIVTFHRMFFLCVCVCLFSSDKVYRDLDLQGPRFTTLAVWKRHHTTCTSGCRLLATQCVLPGSPQVDSRHEPTHGDTHSMVVDHTQYGSRHVCVCRAWKAMCAGGIASLARDQLDVCADRTISAPEQAVCACGRSFRRKGDLTLHSRFCNKQANAL